jgi:hypothetical protein
MSAVIVTGRMSCWPPRATLCSFPPILYRSLGDLSRCIQEELRGHFCSNQSVESINYTISKTLRFCRSLRIGVPPSISTKETPTQRIRCGPESTKSGLRNKNFFFLDRAPPKESETSRREEVRWVLLGSGRA